MFLEMRFGSRWFLAGAAQRYRLAMLPLLLLTSSAFAASLEVAEFASLPGNQIEIDLVFSGVPPKPSDFATENPARIAIDFPGATNQIGRQAVPIGLGAAVSLVAIEASDRTRVVINLADSVPYSLRTKGNRVTVVLNPDPSPMPVVSATGARSSDSGPARRTSNRSFGAVKDIDFRRGADGAGRVIITLPSAEVPVNVSEEGRDVVVGLPGTALPQRLFRRLDVVDFGTPVVAVESRRDGNDVRIDIQTSSDYDYLAYQTDNLFTVEFRSLTPAEKEQLLKEQVVYSGDRLSLNFQDIEVRAVLQLLADFTGLNLVASDTVAGSITLRLKDVPWDQALDIVLKTKGLSMRRAGNVIMVAPTQEIATQEKLELESQQQIQELAPLRTQFVQINYAKAQEIAEILKGHRDQVGQIQQLGGTSETFELRSDRQAPILSGRGSVTFDPRTNSLILNDTADKLAAIRELIARLDIPVRQVLIDARVVIASNDFARDLGVRFGVSGSTGSSDGNQLMVGGGVDAGTGGIDGLGNFDAGPYGFDLSSGTPFNSIIQNDNGAPNLWVNLPAPTPSGAINFLLGKVGSHLITLELSAMQRENRGEVISSPRVVTSDQNQATISVGTKIPYRTLTQDGPQTQFEEATLKLDVTPHITPDDRIIMDLQVSKDSPDYPNITPDGVPIEQKSVTTNVLVDNGETLVLGGVYEQVKSFEREQVPWLGDLPVVGNLFKRTRKQDNNEELLIFVTPKILKSELAVR